MIRAIGISAILLVLAASAGATPNGIWNLARPESGSCGNCHGLPQGTGPVPLLVVDGVPERYEPGAVYELRIQVLGPVLPLAGFNLEATGGRLVPFPPGVPEGGVPQVGFFVDECEALQDDGWCCGPDDVNCDSGPCETRISGECPHYGPEHPDCACDPAEKGNPEKCRPCDDSLIVSVQASHANVATVPVWTLQWHAPDCGFGDVAFYLAGNSANGVNADDEGDLWGVLAEPVVSSPSTPCEGDF